jgi:AcrR family transcriptional regulator
MVTVSTRPKAVPAAASLAEARTESVPPRRRRGSDGTEAGPVRGRPRSAEADRAITEAAVSLLMDESYAGVTMAGVAARAGVSTATLYRRFQNKDDLILDALLVMGDKRTFPDTGSLPGDLHEMLAIIMQSLQGTGGRVVEALIGETSRNKALAARFRERLETPHQSQISAIIDRAVERGEIPEPADVPLVVNLIVGPLYHRFLLTGEPLRPKIIDELVPIILRALDYRPVAG